MHLKLPIGICVGIATVVVGSSRDLVDLALNNLRGRGVLIFLEGKSEQILAATKLWWQELEEKSCGGIKSWKKSGGCQTHWSHIFKFQVDTMRLLSRAGKTMSCKTLPIELICW